MARPVYSSQLVAQSSFAGTGLVTLFTTPPGFVAVIRCITISVGFNVGPGGTAIYAGFSALPVQILMDYFTITSDPGTRVEDMHHVVPETEIIAAARFGGYVSDIYISGYLLSL